MPILESLIGLTQRGGRRPARGLGRDEGREQRPFDRSLTGSGEDTWTPSGAAPRKSELALSRETAGVERGIAEGRKVCGNAMCRSVWTPPWKNREHPIFEDRWACSAGCAEAMVRAALARETGEWPEDDGPVEHQHRIPLGLVVLAHGWITHPELQRALEAQRTNGFGRIGEWLVSEGGLSQEQVTRGLSAQWNCPVLTLDGFSPQTAAMALPQVLIEEYGALPLRVAGGKALYVGFQDRLDAACSFAMGQMSGLKTESGVMGETNFRRARARLLESRFPWQAISLEADRDTLADSVAATIERTRPVASKLLKVHRYYWLRIWNNGGECRPGSTLPNNVDAVSDYLFTIERHVLPLARRQDGVAGQRVEIPVEIKADEQASDLIVEPEDSLAGKTTVKAEAALAVIEREEVFAQAGSEKFEAARSVALSRPPGWKETGSVEGVKIELGGVETIDGEYLVAECGDGEPAELPSQEANGFVSLHRRSGWIPFRPWLQRGLTALRRGERPGSGPGQEG